MSTEIIVAIIGAVAVVIAAIITKDKKIMTPKTKDKKRSDEFHQQNADIHGNCNDVEQSMNGSGGSQSANIKGNSNSINQKIK